MIVKTPDGTWTYTYAPYTVSGTTYGNTTTVVDPGGNTAVYTFTETVGVGEGADSPLLTQVTKTQAGANSPAVTVLSCYNGNSTNCTTTFPTWPLTEVDTYTTLAGMSTSARSTVTYDKYGNILTSSSYDFGATVPTSTMTATYGTYSSAGCVA